MDTSNLTILWNIIVAICFVYADIIRDDRNQFFEGLFNVVHKGRMLRVLMSFNNVKLEICAVHCAQHLRCRTFNYHHDKKDCELTDEDFNEMNIDTITPGWFNYGTPPKVDGGWSSWKNLTECTKTCGSGTMNQWRDCNSPKAKYGGSNCKGKIRRTVKCNTHGCLVDGGWSNWKNSTQCTRACGFLEQSHACDSPKAEYGGADCEERMRRRVKSNTHGCPVVNVALNKVAEQSTVFRNNPDYAASRAVDGSTSTVAQTLLRTNWWKVDLGKVKVIKVIYLDARTHPYNKGLLVETRIKESEPWIMCKEIGDLKTRITKVTCTEQHTNAQFLRIYSTERCHLSIYEVKIFEY